MKFSKDFKKGQELGPELDEFIMDCLSKVCVVKQIKGGYPHDKTVNFKRKTKVAVIVI